MELTYNVFLDMFLTAEHNNFFICSDQFYLVLIILTFLVFEVLILDFMDKYTSLGSFLELNFLNVMASIIVSFLIFGIIMLFIIIPKTMMIIIGIILLKIGLYYLIRYLQMRK